MTSPTKEIIDIEVTETEMPEKNTEKPRAKSRKPLYIATAIALTALLIGAIWWFYKSRYVTTDDARIEGNITVITSKIPAYVKQVNVNENQFVKKGDVLLELESQEYEVALRQAQANLQAAYAKNKKALAEADYARSVGNSAIQQARSGVETARTSIRQSQEETSLRNDLSRKASGAVETARANLKQTEAQIPIARAQIEQARSQAVGAKGAYDAAKLEYARDQELVASGYVSKQKAEHSEKEMLAAQSNYESALRQIEIAEGRLSAARRGVEAEKSRINQANADASAARSEIRKSHVDTEVSASKANESRGKLSEANSLRNRVAVENGSIAEAVAEIERAQADVEKAELDLSYTKIVAPQDGYIAKKSVVVGQLVQPDVAMMSVTLPGIWIVGNFKETDLSKIKVGASAEIRVDAYPGKAFKGKVESFQPGTGSRFSVLPADNAGGNFVKVVQKIPVKIVFETQQQGANLLLVPGMSVVPYIRAK